MVEEVQKPHVSGPDDSAERDEEQKDVTAQIADQRPQRGRETRPNPAAAIHQTGCLELIRRCRVTEVPPGDPNDKKQCGSPCEVCARMLLPIGNQYQTDGHQNDRETPCPDADDLSQTVPQHCAKEAGM